MAPAFDLVCLSHLRWDFVFQRPQHLLTRCARERRVFFIEEPETDPGPARLVVGTRPEGVTVVTPHLRPGLDAEATALLLRALLDDFFREQHIARYALWYYTPMALGFTRHLAPLATIYDCMDELSAFRGAPPALRELERDLFSRADLVFTGGQSLFEAKHGRHHSVHLFPSSVDTAHFAQARTHAGDPPDQAPIPGPRLGFFGVIDERLDIELVDGIAAARPDWQLVMVGPVVKIDPADLPRRPNIHYLGSKQYTELPAYLSGWDVALMPFARNEATRFISPTKTPEYLAAGKPVVSTSIRDVVRPYGERGLVRIADTVAETVAAVEASLAEDANARLVECDGFLSSMSWDRTWRRMHSLIQDVVEQRVPSSTVTGLANRTAPLEREATSLTASISAGEEPDSTIAGRL